MHRTRRRAVTPPLGAVALSAAAVFVIPYASHAQTAAAPASTLTRPQLLEEAQAAAARGNAARAYALALQASAMQQTPSVSLFLARQSQALRKPQDALSHAENCLRMLNRDETIRFREELTAQCTELSHAVRATAGYVVLRIPAGGGVRLRVDGADVPASMHGLPYAVEPGQVRVELIEEGRPRERMLTIARGQSETITVATFHDAAATVGDDDLVTGPGRGGQRPNVGARGPGAGPWVVVGIGGAAAITGAVLWGLASSATAGCETIDGVGVCGTQDQVDRAMAAPGFALGGNIAVPVGIAAIGGGVLWYVLARPRGGSGTSGANEAGCRPGGVGVACGF